MQNDASVLYDIVTDETDVVFIGSQFIAHHLVSTKSEHKSKSRKRQLDCALVDSNTAYMSQATGFVQLISSGSQLLGCGALDEALETFKTAHKSISFPRSLQETWQSSLDGASDIVHRAGGKTIVLSDPCPDLYEEGACDFGPTMLAHAVIPDGTEDSCLAEAIVVFDKALTYHLKRDLAMAEPLYESSRGFIDTLLRQVREPYTPSLIDVAIRCFNNLGSIRYKNDDSHRLFQKALALAETCSDQIQCSIVLSNVCRSRLHHCRLQTTETPHSTSLRHDIETVLKMRQVFLANNDVQIAAARFNLARISRRKPETALHHLRAYLDVATSSNGKLSSIPALVEIILLERKGMPKLLEATRQLYAERTTFGPNSLRLGPLLASIGTELFQQLHYEAALCFFHEQLRIENMHGDDPAEIHHNIGRIHQETGNWDAALCHYNHAIHTNKTPPSALDYNSQGEEEVYTESNACLFSEIWYNLGFVQDRIGSRQEAIQAFETALQLRQLVLGNDHPDVVCLHYNIGVLQIEQGRLEEASVSLMEATRIRRNTCQGQLSDHQIVDTLDNLLSHQRTRGCLEQAAETCSHLLAVVERSTEFPDEKSRNEKLASVLQMTAELSSEMGQPETALRLSINGIEKLRISGCSYGMSGKNEHVVFSEQLISLLLLLGSLYHELSEPIKAVHFLAKAADIVQHTKAYAHQRSIPRKLPSINALVEVTSMLKHLHCAPGA